MDKADEVTKLVQYEWRPLMDRAVSKHISALSDSPKAKSHIDHAFMLELNERCFATFKTSLKLHGMFILCLSLIFLSLKSNDFGFSIIWFSAESVYKNKAILIMMMSCALVFGSIVHMHHDFLKKIRSSLYGFVYEKEFIPIQKVVFDEINLEFINVKSFQGIPGFYYYFVLAVFVVFSFGVWIVYIVATVYMQWSVAVDLHENALTDNGLNLIVLCFFYAGITSQVSSLLLTLPIPGKDYSNLTILDKLQKEDPDKYRSALTNIYIHQRRRYRRNVFVYGSIVYLSVYIYVVGRQDLWDFNPAIIIFSALSLEATFRLGQVARKHTLEFTVSGGSKLVRAAARMFHASLVICMPWAFAWLLYQISYS